MRCIAICNKCDPDPDCGIPKVNNINPIINCNQYPYEKIY